MREEDEDDEGRGRQAAGADSEPKSIANEPEREKASAYTFERVVAGIRKRRPEREKDNDDKTGQQEKRGRFGREEKGAPLHARSVDQRANLVSGMNV